VRRDRRSGRLASAHRGLGCSSVCSRDAVDRGSGARRGETRRLPVQSRCWTTWTRRAFVDAGRLTHNPEVAGSNPAPATSFRRSGPFPGRERAFCVPGTVVKRVVGAGLRAARRRDGGDGVTLDETAWTWWTLPPATAGRLAQRYRKCIPVPVHSCWTSRNVRSPGLGRGRQWLCWHLAAKSAGSAPLPRQ
jgi:hypothetical protein